MIATLRAALVLLGLVLLPASAQATKNNDVRVLIDVSGSMKQNDPHKLRAPALRLLVGLLPEGSESGVWTFGQFVNMQVKHRRVDARWKKQARLESEKIHSRGMFTNIEDALKRASVGWTQADAKTRRNLILLTDGVVDISPDAKKNAASRKRILTELLPRLKKAGAHLHTIALSDAADQNLLKQISAATGGSYVQVDNANALERAFLKLFEKTAPADSLPIKGNRFRVDTSVQDMTVLVFRKEGEPIELVSPQGKSFDYQNHPKGFSWYQEQSYELLSVKKPSAGEWLVKGSKDPDNRVMIVTNLKLNTSELPPSILAGDELVVEAELLDKGRRITRKSFLNLVKFEVEVNNNKHHSMQDKGEYGDKKKADGRYSINLHRELSGGEQALTIRAKGATFEREIRYTVDYFLSIVDVKLTEDEAAENLYLSIIPHVEIVQAESLNIKVKLENGDVIPIHQEPGGLWLSEINSEHNNKFVVIHVQAKRHTGEAVETKIKKKLTLKMPEKKTHAPSSEHETSGNEHEENNNNADTEEVVEDEETNWFLIGWVTMIVNLVIGIIGVLGFQFWKKKKAVNDQEEEKEMEV